MPTISYAQNGEDIRLARAFPPSYRGFYIEVGAFDPVDLSPTKLFYDRGWRGISVEPSPTQYRKVLAGRPGTHVLNVAVSDKAGKALFHESVGEGLSTLQSDEATRFTRDGFEHKAYEVSTRTLASICEEHVDGPIDFLIVDVEGHEESVLRGADFRRFRPKIAVVEATKPRSKELSHASWEEILLSADYRFAAFDGVSRYYVAAEHVELIDAIAVPPNALDEYVPYAQHRAEAELSRLRHSPLTAPSLFFDKLLRRATQRVLRKVGWRSDG